MSYSVMSPRHQSLGIYATEALSGGDLLQLILVPKLAIMCPYCGTVELRHPVFYRIGVVGSVLLEGGLIHC